MVTMVSWAEERPARGAPCKEEDFCGVNSSCEPRNFSCDVERQLRRMASTPSSGPDTPSSSGMLIGDDGDGASLSRPILARVQSVGGAKTIGTLGSLVLMINNIMGPGMVALPFVFQSSGWAPATFALGVCGVFSALAGTMLCEAMQRIPGNRAYGTALTRYEYCDVVRHYWGAGWQQVSHVFFNGSMQASNIAAMVVCAQQFDDFLVLVCGCAPTRRRCAHRPHRRRQNRRRSPRPLRAGGTARCGTTSGLRRSSPRSATAKGLSCGRRRGA